MKTTEDRFWSKVVGGDHTTCWDWTASGNQYGYGLFGVSKGHNVSAHRWAYESMVTDIPVGLQLDHLCRSRRCVNPWHLEPVTQAENLRRGAGQTMTTCPHGHAYDAANTAITRRGSRRCRTCDRNNHAAARRLART